MLERAAQGNFELGMFGMSSVSRTSPAFYQQLSDILN